MTHEQFYEAIKQCIADEEYCRRLGANARKLVEEQHNINNVTKYLIDFYERVK